MKKMDKILGGFAIFLSVFGILWLTIAMCKLIKDSKKEISTETRIVTVDSHKYIMFFDNGKCVYVEHSPSCECMSLGIDYD